MKKYVVTIFREEGKIEELDSKQMDELDELMSSIGDDTDGLENFKIPERVKKESQMMEKMLNFYVTFLGGFWIGRGDSFYLRLLRKPMLDSLFSQLQAYDDKPETLNYYGKSLYQYAKNVFYYRYATDNVRAGKQKFFVPYQSDQKKIYSSMSVLSLMDENALITLLQDFNPKDLRVYVKNKKILDLFKSSFLEIISSLLEKNQRGLLQFVYTDLVKTFSSMKNLVEILNQFIQKQDIFHLKENIYSLDFWVMHSFCKRIVMDKLSL
ncbi:MAG: hypothetical protein GXP45_05260 [bacterium]|nr:hypothetical protein [bacterium]